MKDDIGDRMRAYEDITNDIIVSKDKPVIIRLDGRHFSTLTSALEKPFCQQFYEAMEYTAQAVFSEFKFDLVYFQSDEISCIWKPLKSELSSLPFNGRVVKLASNIASYTTMMMNQYLFYEPSLRKLLYGYATFDARVFNVPDLHEATNNIFWRYLDCRRNAVQGYARKVLGQKEIQNVPNKELLDRIKDKNWCDVGHHFKYGSSIINGPEDIEYVDYSSVSHNLRYEMMWGMDPLTDSP